MNNRPRRIKGYKIEKGIPVIAREATQPKKYPWPDMEVGDSFAVGADKIKMVRGALSHYVRNKTVKFVTRREGDHYRVWKIA